MEDLTQMLEKGKMNWNGYRVFKLARILQVQLQYHTYYMQMIHWYFVVQRDLKLLRLTSLHLFLKHYLGSICSRILFIQLMWSIILKSWLKLWAAKQDHFPPPILGLPLGSKFKWIDIWNGAIEKVERRLATWQLQYLSIGGRLTLINNVLIASLHTTCYYTLCLALFWNN